MSDLTWTHATPRSSCARSRPPWRPGELAAMIVGFVLFWPLGLAVLAWKKNWFGLRDRLGERPFEGLRFPAFGWGRRTAGAGMAARHDLARDSGNSAFEEHKAAELHRLEAEFAALAARQQEFEDFLRKLREAKDREEFERFMAGHRSVPSPVVEEGAA